MRQAEVQSRLLDLFPALYPQFAFRGVRRLPHRAYGPFDLVLRVALGRAGRELDLLCVALTEGFPEEVQRFARRLRDPALAPLLDKGVPVLVAPFFSEEARALCRQEGLGCLDLAGNVLLDRPEAYVEVSGKANAHLREKRVRTPFEGKAERVARALLLGGERRWAMRALAEAAQVSLGMASMVTTALAGQGLVHKGREGLEVASPSALLEAWAQSYDLRRSRYAIYRTDAGPGEIEQRLVQSGQAPAERCALTLWSGAERLFGQQAVLPRLALYWRDRAERLAQLLDLSPDRGRTYFFVFEPYDESLLWQAQPAGQGLAVVHPLQLYLDLGSGDDEELRLAQRVRDRLLGW